MEKGQLSQIQVLTRHTCVGLILTRSARVVLSKDAPKPNGERNRLAKSKGSLLLSRGKSNVRSDLEGISVMGTLAKLTHCF
jgi:hypothetical protein